MRARKKITLEIPRCEKKIFFFVCVLSSHVIELDDLVTYANGETAEMLKDI